MNKFATLTAAATLALASMSMAHAAPQVIAADQRTESQLCAASANLSLFQFSQYAKQKGYNLKSLARQLSCNQLPLAVFAKRYNAHESLSGKIAKLSREEVQTQVASQQLLVLNQNLTVYGS